MIKAHQKLAEALKILKRLQSKQGGVVQAGDLKDGHRALLVDEGFLQPVIKGWYICTYPRDREGDSTAWYVSYWAFLAGYLGERFGKRYCLNAEASLMLHTGSTLVPPQMVIVCPEGGTSAVTLPFGSSLLIYTDKKNFSSIRTQTKGLQSYTLAESLCRLPPRVFLSHPREVEIALGMIGDVRELLFILLQRENMVTAAGRLAGALRFMQRPSDADRILQTMKLSKHKVREVNPFTIETPTLLPCRERSPYVLRLASMWSAWRNDVLELFPAPPGLPVSVQ